MKKILYLLYATVYFVQVQAQDPNSWQQMKSLGNSATPRIGAVSFSIGSKGYIGTGEEGNFFYKKDFWEYDPITDIWTQKADFAGGERSYAVGFSIGNKGYIGTGNYQKDFWEYNPSSNTWTRKADFGGAGRTNATGFSIGTKGYIGTGFDGLFPAEKDFWEYNPSTNIWTRKADFGGQERVGAIGFSIDGKGYIGTGASDSDSYSIIKKDFWEYNPSTNRWTRKADCSGGERTGATSFSIHKNGYVAAGYNYSEGYLKDFWEYCPFTNRWTKKADFSGGVRGNPIGFSIGGKGYIGTGFDGSYLQKDFWEYDCHENAWTPKTGFGAVERTGAIGFSIGGKGYVGTGFGNTGSSYPSDLKDFWEYDPSTNVWTQKADFGGGNRSFAVGFSIGRKGYIGTGNYQKDFWEYNPSANIWTRKTDFGGPGRSDAVGFSIGNKGYIGTGYDPNDPNYYKKDFWEYDPATNAWTRKANFKGTERVGAVGFSIGNKGYIGTGYDVNITNKKDFWEYDPSVNVWVKKADFAGKGRYNAVGFSIGRKGYIGTGFGEDTLGYSSNKNDFWEYNQFTDNWTRKADFGGIGRSEATGFSIGRYGYIGFGTDFFKYYNDWWQYTPSGVSPVQSITFNASLQKTNALLSWQTTNDVNTSYFNIQRSLDGVNFTTIAKQDARGDIVQQYPYTDANVTALLHEKIFYRLQSMHKDSSSAYSNIAELNINNSNGITFFIYPNPVKDKLHININCRKNETFSIRIVDMNGRQVYTEKITSLANNFNHYINVGKLAMGIYTIQLLNGKGVSKTSFVKEL